LLVYVDILCEELLRARSDLKRPERRARRHCDGRGSVSPLSIRLSAILSRLRTTFSTIARMAAGVAFLDAHEQPSDELRGAWKTLSRADPGVLIHGHEIDDLSSPERAAEFCLAGSIPSKTLREAFHDFTGDDLPGPQVADDAPIYHHPLLPGLLIVPSLVPPGVQEVLLSRLIHRDLSDPRHKTNIHPFFQLPYPDPASSFFSYPPDSTVQFEPKDPQIHKPLSVRQALGRKLHWVTLGGQYDWNNRVYPGEEPPPFPPDIAALLESLFPETLAQAAIVNFYTPGDTMMLHRDVSEETDKGLVSISMGCDGLFMIAPNSHGKSLGGGEPEDAKQYLLLRIRSGDAIYMTKDSRFAWHGVPKVLEGTCPDYLADWPAQDGQYEEWRGWMRNKRINLNVRQMRN